MLGTAARGREQAGQVVGRGRGMGPHNWALRRGVVDFEPITYDIGRPI
jgi:hypothetical protein